MRRRGNVMVMFVPFVFIFFGFSILVLNISRAVLTEQKIQTAADASLLSSLRLRAEALQIISDRWLEIGRYYVEGFANGQVLVPSASWTVVQRGAETLRRAVPGYQGRVTAVVGVVLDANGIPQESARFVLKGAQSLGLTAEPITLRNEGGQTKRILGGWYRRNWERFETAPQPSGESTYEILLEAPPWKMQRSSRVHLRWDVNTRHPDVQLRGNGGYPGQWAQALEGGHVQPYRFPLFSARLGRSRSVP